MPGFDELLTRELQHIARPADPTRALERIDRKRARRARMRRLQAGALIVVVLTGTAGGVAVLLQTFKERSLGVGGDVTSVPIVSKSNGRIVAAQQARGGPLQLVSVNPDGSGRQVIPTNVDPAEEPWLSAWSPDGSKLAVAMAPSGYGPVAIWVMNADGSSPVKVAEATNVYQPSWSPDGTRIAYAADTLDGSAIHIVNANGTGDHVIAEVVQHAPHYFSASFSPDGTQILFDAGTDSEFDIFVMHADGTNVRQLTNTGSDYSPSWSPDGSQIAFSRRGPGGGSDIFVMDADGSNVRQLTDGNAGVTNRNPTWSPDGTLIAYHAGATRDGPGSLVVMNTDGSDPVTILDGGVIGISWQPILIPASGQPQVTTSPTVSGNVMSIAGPTTIPGVPQPACNVSEVTGDFWSGTSSTVYFYQRKLDVGGCPAPGDGFTVVGIAPHGGDVTGSYGPLGCHPACHIFAAPDIDGDGLAELAISQTRSASTVFFTLYRVVETAPGVTGPTLVLISRQGSTDQFAWGGPVTHPEGARCQDGVYGRSFWVWQASPLAGSATYHVSEEEGVLTGNKVKDVMENSYDVSDFSTLPGEGGATLCGAPVMP
jgi:hypothetical protein